MDLVVVFELEGCLGTCDLVDLVREGDSDSLWLRLWALDGEEILFLHMSRVFKVCGSCFITSSILEGIEFSFQYFYGSSRSFKPDRFHLLVLEAIQICFHYRSIEP